MKLLCIVVSKPDAGEVKNGSTIEDEVRHAWKMYKSGFVRELYFRQDRAGVILIAEAESVDVAKKILDNYPYARDGRIGWEVIPLGPFINWELLFANNSAEKN